MITELDTPERAEREEILAAARRTGDSWLRYMGMYAEPAVTPLAWREALSAARGAGVAA